MIENFSDIIGQKNIIKYLKWSLNNDTVAKTLILFGEAGIGKTTIAKVLAKRLLCLKPINDQSCGLCNSCKSFNNRHIDFFEIDSALNSNVENIRDMIEVARYKPQISFKRVFIFDECHKLSNSAFSALLKTLEESAHFNYFIFITTNVDKLPDSIISRAVRLRLEIPDEEDLKKFLNKQNIKKDIHEELIYISRGKLRDLNNVLSMLELVKDINLIKNLIGIPNRTLLIQYWLFILNFNTNAALKTLYKITKITGNYFSSLNLLIIEMKKRFPVLLHKVTDLLVTLGKILWLDGENIAVLFTCRFNRLEDDYNNFLFKLALKDQKLFNKVNTHRNRLILTKEGFNLLGFPKLNSRLKTILENEKE